MIREPIYAALWNLAQASAGFVTKSRRAQYLDDVPQGMFPALFMIQKSESPQNVAGLPAVWVFTVEFYIYAHTQGDKTIMPSTILNGLIDAVSNSIAPDAVTGKQTLGGLVQHAWIDGGIDIYEGVLGDQAVAVIPVTIKVNS